MLETPILHAFTTRPSTIAFVLSIRMTSCTFFLILRIAGEICCFHSREISVNAALDRVGSIAITQTEHIPESSLLFTFFLSLVIGSLQSGVPDAFDTEKASSKCMARTGQHVSELYPRNPSDHYHRSREEEYSSVDIERIQSRMCDRC